MNIFYEWRKKVACLFCLSHWNLPNHNTSCYAHGMVAKSSMSEGCTELVSLCFKLRWRSYWTLLNIFLSTENSFKAKLEITWEFGCNLDIDGNPSLSRI
jgi:hypothetical protein